MQFPWTRNLSYVLKQKATVGGLMDLCEENYRHLRVICPELSSMQGARCSKLSGHMDLYLEVLEQTKYTTLVHLTYFFAHHEGQQPDPDAILRVYHDACQVEVMDLNQQILPTIRLFDAPGLENKWKANLFISKWLSFCASQGHRFAASNPRPESTEILLATG